MGRRFRCAIFSTAFRMIVCGARNREQRKEERIAAFIYQTLNTSGRPICDNECLVWMPRDLVFRLLALREPEETLSDVILRLVERGSFAALTR
jgi:hypothetical protein